MRRTVSSRLMPLWAFVLAALVSAPAALFAQAESDSSKTTGQSDDKAKKDGGVSIKIDGDGIRIEGQLGEEEDSLGGGNRIIFDRDGVRRDGGTRKYREKGTDLVKFGEDIFVGADELVRGDIVVFGGEVTVEGKVVGNVVVMAGDATMISGAEINGDVVVLGGSLIEEPEVIIHGERVEMATFNLGWPGLMGQSRFFDFFFIPVQFFVSVILSFLIILFLRDRIVVSKKMVERSFFKSLGVGFLVVFVGSFAVTVLALILAITLIGIPLAFALVVSCVAIFIMARTVFVYALGSKISDMLKMQTMNPFAIVLVGTAVLYLPALIGYGISFWPLGGPVGGLFKFIGMVVSLFGYLVGLGALFVTRFGGRGLEEAQPAVAVSPAHATPAPE